jgi:colanic acid biosynthesis glycosyl transferase WcaI
LTDRSWAEDLAAGSTTGSVVHETDRNALGTGLAEAPGRRPYLVPFRRAGVGRVILVNRFFPPDEAPTAQLLADLAAHLVRAKMVPTIIAGRSRHATSGRSPADGGFVIRRVWTGTLSLPGILGRACEYLSFAILASRQLRKEIRRDDLVVVKTDPPLMSIIVGAIARRRGAHVVNWCQDLFPEIAAAVGIPLTRGYIGSGLKAWRLREQKRAALNVAICDSMAARLRADGVPAERVTVIPNWAGGGSIVPVDHKANRWREEHGFRDRYVIGYSGNLGRVHDPRPIFGLMQRMVGNPDLLFAIIGGGTGNVTLQRMVERAGLQNVRFLPYQPQHRVAESLSAIDLHLVSLRAACEGLSFPSKLIGVFAAGRPVLFVGDPAGEVAAVVRASGAGLALDGTDPEALERAANTLRTEGAARGRAGRRFFEQRFSKDLALSSWLACLGLDESCLAVKDAESGQRRVGAGARNLELTACLAQPDGVRPGI